MEHRAIATLSLTALVSIFLLAAAVVWVAGVYLANTTDVISSRFGLGEALGGMILLALVTNLPEVVITASAAWHGNLGLAVGNILGGIAVQTVVLALLDAFGVGRAAPLTYRAASLAVILEGVLVVAILAITIIGHELPAGLIAARLTPAGVLIVVVWVSGVWLIGKARNTLPWRDDGNAPQGQEAPRGHAEKQKEEHAVQQGRNTLQTVAIFALAAAATLAAGVVLERAGDQIADRIGMSGVLFGATVLAAATSLPEVSTGLTSVKLRDYQLAVSDIFGGNAFLPVLFVEASLISGKAVLPLADRIDLYLTALGILLTAVYLAGLILRSRRQIGRLGVDSLVVVVLYCLGVAGLALIK